MIFSQQLGLCNCIVNRQSEFPTTSLHPVLLLKAKELELQGESTPPVVEG